MKFFTLLSFLLFALIHTSIAQSAFSDSLGDEIHHIFANVDKSIVSSGYLEEYGADFISFAPFNGVLTDSNEVDKSIMRLLYGSLLTSKINTSAASLPSLAVFNDSAKSIQQRTGAVPVPILYMAYNTIRPDAISQNLLQVVNGQLQDVPNRTENPYPAHTLFAVAPLKDKANGGTVSFIFPSHLFLTNKNVSVTTIQADFGDGRGIQSYALDTPFSISFTGTGSKQVTFTIKFSDNQTYKCYTTLHVNYIDSTAYARYGVDDTWYIFPDITKAGGTVRVLYGSTGGIKHTSITKPLIIAEGYDIHYAAPDLQDNYSISNLIFDLNKPFRDDGYDFLNTLEKRWL